MLVLFACSDPTRDDLDDARARIAVLEAQDKAHDAQIVELEGRLQAQAEQVSSLAKRVEQLAPVGLAVEADGRVTRTLDGGAAVSCAKAELEGLMTARFGRDAAFDDWGESFEQLGWQPDNRGDCATNVAFSLGPRALRLIPDGSPPKVPMGVAVVVRGAEAGRAFAVDDQVRVYELPRVPESELRTVVAGAEWLGGGRAAGVRVWA